MSQNILKIYTNAFQKSQKSQKSSPLKADTYYYSNNNEIESSVNFILSHFEEPLYPRKISTFKSNNKQFLVRSRQEIIDSFIDSNFVDCRINAYPYLIEYKDVPRYKPDFLFIDLDKNNFKNNRSFELAFYNTIKNIKNKLNGYPTVLFTGGGYHIYQPIDIPTALENIIEFNEFERPSEQYLRFAKDFLSIHNADKQSNPSFRSCLLRIPGSINSKYNSKVIIMQKWNGERPLVTRELLEDFRTYLIQKKIDEDNRRRHQKILQARKSKNGNNNNYYYDWIETKILPNPFSDCRKLAVGLILAPYLVVINKLTYEESFTIINEWLMKCDSVRKLNFDPKYMINNSIKTSTKKLIPPISIYKLETNYPNLYFLIDQKKRKKEEE